MFLNKRKTILFVLFCLHLFLLFSKNKAQQSVNELETDVHKTGDSIDLSHGFGDDIDWVSWPNAIQTATEQNKPIFLLIHKTWCGACQALKKSFNTSSKRPELVNLSKSFVMVNTEDDEEPEEDEYAPDGRYIPRLFLTRKTGEPLPIYNSENFPNNIAYFPQLTDVVKAMKKALKMLRNEQKAEERMAADSPESPPGKNKNKEEKRETEGGLGNGNVETNIKKKKSVPDKESKTSTSNGESKQRSQEKDETNLADVKGGCPHAAGKAAAKKIADKEAAIKEETKKNQMKKKDEKVGVVEEDKKIKETEEVSAKKKTKEAQKKSKEDPKKPKKVSKEEKNEKKAKGDSQKEEL